MEEKIRQIIEEALEDDKLFLVDLKILGAPNGQKVLITLDGDEGVKIEDCARVSRKTGYIIEEDELIENKYILEVSSPGLDQPLQLPRQYVKNIGRMVKVTLKDQRILKGTMEDVNEDGLTLLAEVKEKGKKKITEERMEILFEEIDKTNIIVSFK